jgi:hypothetical protein
MVVGEAQVDHVLRALTVGCVAARKNERRWRSACQCVTSSVCRGISDSGGKDVGAADVGGTDGELRIQLREGDVVLRAGQLFVVPRGIEHCPIADGEVHAVLIEPVGVVNTGDANGALTAAYDDSLISPRAARG